MCVGWSRALHFCQASISLAAEECFWTKPDLGGQEGTSRSSRPDSLCSRCMLTTSLWSASLRMMFFRLRKVLLLHAKGWDSRLLLRPHSRSAWILSLCACIWERSGSGTNLFEIGASTSGRYTCYDGLWWSMIWLPIWLGHACCIAGLASSMLSVCQEISLLMLDGDESAAEFPATLRWTCARLPTPVSCLSSTLRLPWVWTVAETPSLSLGDLSPRLLIVFSRQRLGSFVSVGASKTASAPCRRCYRPMVCRSALARILPLSRRLFFPRHIWAHWLTCGPRVALASDALRRRSVSQFRVSTIVVAFVFRPAGKLFLKCQLLLWEVRSGTRPPSSRGNSQNIQRVRASHCQSGARRVTVASWFGGCCCSATTWSLSWC